MSPVTYPISQSLKRYVSKLQETRERHFNTFESYNYLSFRSQFETIVGLTNCDIKVKKHKLVPAAPSTSPPLPVTGLRGIFSPYQSRCTANFEGIPKFCAARGRALQPRDHPWAFDTLVVSYPEDNDTEDFSGRTSISAHLPRTGKIVEVEGSKGMFSILCMHSFISYQVRITKRNWELSTWIKTFLAYWIKFLLILFE